jgi:hypothetical protein
MHLTLSLISSTSFLSPRIHTGTNQRLPWPTVAGASVEEAKARQGGVQTCDSQDREHTDGRNTERRGGTAVYHGRGQMVNRGGVRKATRRRGATGEEGRRSTRARPRPCFGALMGLWDQERAITGCSWGWTGGKLAVMGFKISRDMNHGGSQKLVEGERMRPSRHRQRRFEIGGAETSDLAGDCWLVEPHRSTLPSAREAARQRWRCASPVVHGGETSRWAPCDGGDR